MMLFLQENKFYGSIFSMCFVVISYIFVSILIIVRARKNNLDICALGVVPVIQLAVPFMILKNKLKRKPRKDKSDILELDLTDEGSTDSDSEDGYIEF